jgi:hypothetical protein
MNGDFVARKRVGRRLATAADIMVKRFEGR